MSEIRKYRLTDETITIAGVTLYRIQATRDFDNVRKGERGGFIQSENNLSHEDSCWVSENAKVYGNAKVFEYAKVYDNAKVFGDADVYGNAWVYGNASVCGDAEVFGDARVYGNASVCGNADVCGDAWVCGNVEVKSSRDYIVFKNFWSSGRYFTYTRSNGMWTVGCFHGTGDELIRKAYADSQEKGWQYERVVRYVEDVERHEKEQGGGTDE